MFIQQKEKEKEKSKNNNEDELLYYNFINGLKTKTTKLEYTKQLKYFLEFLGASNGDYSVLVDPKKDKKMIEADIQSFLVYLREKRKLSYRSAS